MSHCWIGLATFPAAGYPLEIQAANDGFWASPAASGPCPFLRSLALAEPDPSVAAISENAPRVIRTLDRLLRRLAVAGCQATSKTEPPLCGDTKTGPPRGASQHITLPPSGLLRFQLIEISLFS